MKTIGIIGGSGLYEMGELSDIKSVSIETPWGNPSSNLVTGTLGNTRMVFLPRHGCGAHYISIGDKFPGEHIRDESHGSGMDYIRKRRGKHERGNRAWTYIDT